MTGREQTLEIQGFKDSHGTAEQQHSVTPSVTSQVIHTNSYNQFVDFLTLALASSPDSCGLRNAWEEIGVA